MSISKKQRLMIIVGFNEAKETTCKHYWKLDCDDDLAEITLPDTIELMAFRRDLEDALGAVPCDEDLVDGASDVLSSIVEQYGGSWHWLCSDWGINVRRDEESEEMICRQ